MGAGIAEVLARSGLSVTGVEINDDLLERGRGRLVGSLDRAVERGRLEPTQRDEVVGRLRFTTDRADLADVDLVIEAVPERLEMKAELFSALHEICPPQTVFATNTSSLPVTAIAAASGRPDRVVGLHFFNPAPVMRLVEVVTTELTDHAVLQAARELAESVGKTPVVVGDRAGFIANTLLVGYLGQAARLVDEGVVSAADLDAAIVAGCGLPMGPLRLLDLIGLDVTVEILRVLDEEFRDPRYAVAPLLRRLVLAGRLGNKSGEGYYRYAGRDATLAVHRGPLPAGLSEPEAAAAAAAGASDDPQLDALEVVEARGGDAEAVRVALGLGPLVSSSTGVVLVALGEDPEGLIAAERLAAGRPVVGVHLPRLPRPTPVVELVVPNDIDAAADLAPAVAAVRRKAEAAGRTVAVVKARRGYAAEALLFGQLDDAARMVGDGYASPADIDTAMTLGCGYPAGPFAMLDAVGAGTVAAALPDPAPYLLELAGRRD